MDKQHLPQTQKNGASDIEIVDVTPLTDLLTASDLSRVDAVKIDVEGAEYEVLQGAKDIFEKNWPKFMFIECIDKYLRRFNSSSKELISFLTDNGYQVYALKWGFWVKVSKSDGLSEDILAIR